MPAPDDAVLPAFAAGLLDADAPVPTALRLISSFPADHGYAVHRNGVLTGIVGALADIFPTTRRLLGPENFSALAAMHARLRPPSSPVLHEYGGEFAAFLEMQADLAHLPFLGDVARLERLWLDSWHAADALPLPPTALASLDEQTLMRVRFRPHPATRLIRLRHAAASLVQIDRAGGDLTGFDPMVPETALITRPDTAVMIGTLSHGDAAFFGAVLEGEDLMTAAGQALTAEPGLSLDAVIARLLQCGAVMALDTGRA